MRTGRGLPLFALGGLLTVGIIATATHHDHNSWQRLSLSYGLAFAVAIIARQATEKDRLRCLTIVVYVAAAEALTALIGLLLHLSPLWIGAQIFPYNISEPLRGGLLGGIRQQGTLGHPLPLAFLLLAGWLILLTAPSLVSPSRRRWLTVLLLVGIVCSATISALLLVPILYVVFRPGGDKLFRGVLLAWLCCRSPAIC
ncbi:MAG TPA: hypothetical protein VIJ50_02300 [Solirubrobacteraceae bacterium]